MVVVLVCVCVCGGATMGMSSPGWSCGFISMCAAALRQVCWAIRLRYLTSISRVTVKLKFRLKRCLQADIHSLGGGFKVRFSLFSLLYAHVPWRNVSTFHNICVRHVTFHAAEQCQYYFCGLGNGVWMRLLATSLFFLFILGGSRSENWEENLHHCSRSSCCKLRPWQFAQIHMPQSVVILIYMKISGRCVHVSFITSAVGDFPCLTEQGCFSFSDVPLWLMYA